MRQNFWAIMVFEGTNSTPSVSCLIWAYSPSSSYSLSKVHEKFPYTYYVPSENTTHVVSYLPGESDSGLFGKLDQISDYWCVLVSHDTLAHYRQIPGGNSNWRGPIWMPTMFLLIESLQRFHYFYGPSLEVEMPTHSGRYADLWQASQEIQHRLIRLFLHNREGKRPVNGECDTMNFDPHFSVSSSQYASECFMKGLSLDLGFKLTSVMTIGLCIVLWVFSWWNWRRTWCLCRLMSGWNLTLQCS